MIRDERGIGTPFRHGDQRVREGLGKAVREHPCPRERGGERLETRVAAERGTEPRDLLGAADYLRSRQHVRAAVPVCVVGEQHGHGGLGDIPLVDDGRTRRLRARDDLARRQLPLPATGVGGRRVAPQHHGAQPGAVEQGFNVRVPLNDRIALARGRVVDGALEQARTVPRQRGVGLSLPEVAAAMAPAKPAAQAVVRARIAALEEEIAHRRQAVTFLRHTAECRHRQLDDCPAECAAFVGGG